MHRWYRCWALLLAPRCSHSFKFWLFRIGKEDGGFFSLFCAHWIDTLKYTSICTKGIHVCYIWIASEWMDPYYGSLFLGKVVSLLCKGFRRKKHFFQHISCTWVQPFSLSVTDTWTAIRCVWCTPTHIEYAIMRNESRLSLIIASCDDAFCDVVRSYSLYCLLSAYPDSIQRKECYVFWMSRTIFRIGIFLLWR